jgi:hypothetical protein
VAQDSLKNIDFQKLRSALFLRGIECRKFVTRGANLGNFSLKNARGFLRPVWNEEIFRGILKVSYKRVVFVKNVKCSKP